MSISSKQQDSIQRSKPTLRRLLWDGLHYDLTHKAPDYILIVVFLLLFGQVGIAYFFITLGIFSILIPLYLVAKSNQKKKGGDR